MPWRSLRVAVLLVSVAAPASALGDATLSLAAHRAMTASPVASPQQRLFSVYLASSERAAMLQRLRALHPAAGR